LGRIKKISKNTENRKIVEKERSHQGHKLTKEVSEKHFHAFVHWKTVFCSFTCTVRFEVFS